MLRQRLSLLIQLHDLLLLNTVKPSGKVVQPSATNATDSLSHTVNTSTSFKRFSANTFEGFIYLRKLG